MKYMAGERDKYVNNVNFEDNLQKNYKGIKNIVSYICLH